LRRQRLQVLRVPFVFTPGIDEAALLQIAERLGRGL
jgi:hypothetical protein